MKVSEGYRKIEMRPWHETVSGGQTGQSHFIPPLSVLLVAADLMLFVCGN